MKGQAKKGVIVGMEMICRKRLKKPAKTLGWSFFPFLK